MASFSNVKAFLRLSRLPFLSVSLVPAILGTVLAAQESEISYILFALTLVSISAIQLATHYMGEYGDFETDSLNKNPTPFSGGSRILPEKLFSPRFALVAALAALGISVALGFLIFFGLETGPLTLPLGFFGILSGFFYTIRPFRWAYTGFGEILIGLCFGWLCVNTPYYLQVGRLDLIPTLASLPAFFSIMAVIIINEFPDFESDRLSGKKNMVVRMEKERMAIVYQVLLALTCLSALLSLFLAGVWWAFFLILPSLFIAFTNIRSVQAHGYHDTSKLVGICGRTIVLNLITTGALAAAFLA